MIFTIGCRYETEDKAGANTIVFPSPNLGQTTVNGRRNVKRGGADQDFNEPVPFPNLVTARREPMANNDRNIRTGPQVGQYHCLQTHGEPRIYSFLINRTFARVAISIDNQRNNRRSPRTAFTFSLSPN